MNSYVARSFSGIDKYLPSALLYIFNNMVVYFFMQRNHTKASIFHIDTFLRGPYLDATKLFEALTLL